MRRWRAWWGRSKTPLGESPDGQPGERADPDAFFASLTPVKVGRNYTRTDRYRDFRRTFATPEGRRALWQIFEACGLYRSHARSENVNETFLRLGERNIGLKILRWMNAEPLDEPERKAQEERRG